MSRVRKMTNVSHLTVAVSLEGTTVYVPPRGILENENVQNLDSVRKFFKIEEDLTEVKPKSNKKQKLND